MKVCNPITAYNPIYVQLSIAQPEFHPSCFKQMAMFPTLWEVCMCLKIISSKIHPFKHSTTNIIHFNSFCSILFADIFCVSISEFGTSWSTIYYWSHFFSVGPPHASVFPSAESLSSSLSFMSVLRFTTVTSPCHATTVTEHPLINNSAEMSIQVRVHVLHI